MWSWSRSVAGTSQGGWFFITIYESVGAVFHRILVMANNGKDVLPGMTTTVDVVIGAVLHGRGMVV